MTSENTTYWSKKAGRRELIELARHSLEHGTEFLQELGKENSYINPLRKFSGNQKDIAYVIMGLKGEDDISRPSFRTYHRRIMNRAKEKNQEERSTQEAYGLRGLSYLGFSS